MYAAAGGLWCSSAGLRALRRICDAALLPGRARGLHGSAVSCGSKNLLKKFASKTRKKFWYEGPSLGSHLTQKPSKLEFLMKSTSKKAKKEDHVRLRALNGLLYKALTDLLCTPEVSQEVYDLNVELSKMDQLLAVADFGPSDERDDLAGDDLRNPGALLPPDSPGSAMNSSLCGIDHEALNKQIMEYKRGKEKGLRGVSLVPRLLEQEQATGLIQWVRRRKKVPPHQDRDASPRSFLSGEEEEEDNEDGTLGCGCQTQEAEDEWRVEARGDVVQRDPCGRTGQG
ncbi:putative ribosome-binding factor A, mitochondrial isoform X3 [Castor canadensis]|uniref:Ribosome-binding factor A, mitochondrial isoform X3 n=1 Tax=Castor canadensis TaxID=51338 RepID=A0AC58M8F7_CASCN